LVAKAVGTGEADADGAAGAGGTLASTLVTVVATADGGGATGASLRWHAAMAAVSARNAAGSTLN
jgi:hypothetical protein